MQKMRAVGTLKPNETFRLATGQLGVVRGSSVERYATAEGEFVQGHKVRVGILYPGLGIKWKDLHPNVQVLVKEKE